MSTGVYFQLYALLHQYIYGLDASLNPHMELVLTQFSTIGSLMVAGVPFLVVFGGLFLIIRALR